MPINQTLYNTTGMTYLNDWYNEENWANISARWMSNDAQIMVYSNGNTTTSLNFTADYFYKPRMLDVYLNHDQIYEREINDYTKVGIPIKLHDGYNILQFNTPDGSQRPIDLPELNSSDPRDLSIVFINMSIEGFK
jgi:hypothetical protein